MTAVVALAGLAANIVISASAGRTQRALVATGHELQAENARRSEKREVYTRFLSDIDAWHRALVPAVRRIRELQETQGDVSAADKFDIGNPDTPAEVQLLIKTFQELDSSFTVVSLVAGDVPHRAAVEIRNHITAATFATLAGRDLEPSYTPNELQERCIQQMSLDLGYRTAAGSQA